MNRRVESMCILVVSISPASVLEQREALKISCASNMSSSTLIRKYIYTGEFMMAAWCKNVVILKGFYHKKLLLCPNN